MTFSNVENLIPFTYAGTERTSCLNAADQIESQVQAILAMAREFPAYGPQGHSIFITVPNTQMYKARRGSSKANSAYVTAGQEVVEKYVKHENRLNEIEILTFYKTQVQSYEFVISPLIFVLTVGFFDRKEYAYVILDMVTPKKARVVFWVRR